MTVNVLYRVFNQNIFHKTKTESGIQESLPVEFQDQANVAFVWMLLSKGEAKSRCCSYRALLYCPCFPLLWFIVQLDLCHLKVL